MKLGKKAGGDPTLSLATSLMQAAANLGEAKGSGHSGTPEEQGGAYFFFVRTPEGIFNVTVLEVDFPEELGGMFPPPKG